MALTLFSKSICEAGTGGKTPSKPYQNHITQELTPRAHHGKTTGSGESNNGGRMGAAQIGQGFPDGNQLPAKTPDSLRREASQAASAAPTLRYADLRHPTAS